MALVNQELSVDVTVSAQDFKWAEAETALFAKDTQKFIRGIAFQEVDYGWVEESLIKVTKLVNDRLGGAANFIVNPQATTPNKVAVVPRGSFASRTALRGHVDLDLDIVVPSTFKIVTNLGDKTIEEVLCTGYPQNLANANPPWHDASGNLVITKVGLGLVLRYIWLKLVHNAPTAATTVNLPPLQPLAVGPGPSIQWLEIGQGKTLDTITRSISCVTKAPERVVDIDFFIKVVTTYQGGQTVVVGVDKDGPLGIRQYQTTTFLSSGLQWLGNDPLPPIDRTALMALKWWKNSFAEDLTISAFKVRDFDAIKAGTGATTKDAKKADIKIKSHHLLSALNALHEVDITDPLYIPRTSSLPFSLVRVIDRMIKILTYLQRAYNPPQNFLVTKQNSWSDTIPVGQVIAEYAFPTYACGTFDSLYKQLNSSITDAELVYKSNVIPTFLKRLTDAQAALIKLNPSFAPNVYVQEDTYVK